MRPLQIRGAVLFALVCAQPHPAAAHNPLPGLEGFYVGLIHPLTTPDQVLLVAGTALVFGSFALASLRLAFAALALGLLGGLLFGESGAAHASWLLALATCAAAWAALLPGRGLPALTGLAALSGVGLGWASVPEAGAPLDRAITMSGSFFGAGLAIFYVTGAMEMLRERVDAPWLKIGLRVLAAWVAAIAIILLALMTVELEPTAPA